MKIIANHAHVFQKEVRDYGTIECLKSFMDKFGIDKAVAFAPFPKSFVDDGKGSNFWLHKQIKNDDRFFGFGIIDFEKSDLKSQVAEIKQLGLKGIKLHPAAQKFKIDGEKAFEVYEAAERECLPISFHTGVHWHRIKDYEMLLFDEVAYNFKNLKFSIEHVGGYSFFKDGVAVMINNPKNVYAGLTSVFDKKNNKFWYLGKKNVEELIWLTGSNRSIFGLDFPYNGVLETEVALSAINSLNITNKEKEQILGKKLLEFINEI